jgi:hypothetical protein
MLTQIIEKYRTQPLQQSCITADNTVAVATPLGLHHDERKVASAGLHNANPPGVSFDAGLSSIAATTAGDAPA